MANEIFKELKTRIALKTLKLSEWEAIKDTYKPLKGEVCICEIPTGNNVPTANSVTPPTVLFKVGDGTNFWANLNWASALAADVYSWAKKSEADFITWVNTVVEHPAAPDLTPYLVETDITTGSANGTIAVRGKDVAVNGLGSAAYTDADAYAPHDIDTGVHSVSLASGTNNGTLKLTVDGAISDNIAVKGLADAAYTTVQSLNETAQGYADAALEEAKSYADAKPHENTAHTHTAGAGLSITGEGGISGSVEYSANIDVKYENSKIYLIDKTSKATIGEGFDASAFVKDSFLENVTYSEKTNDLVFTFVDNSDNKQDITVPLDDLVDVYTADETSLTLTVSGSGKVFKIKEAGVEAKHLASNAVITEKIADDAVTADKIADAVMTEINKAHEHENKAELDKIQSGDVEKWNGKLDANGWVTTGEESGPSISCGDKNNSVFAYLDVGGVGGGNPDECWKITKDNIHLHYRDNENGIINHITNYGLDSITRTVNNVESTVVDIELTFPEEGGTIATTEHVTNAITNSGHISEITTTENNGLKVTNKNNIDIDTDVIFVLDCNW